MSFASNRWRDRRGVTTIELALVFGVFILFVFGVIDLSRYLVAQQELAVLTTAAARQGMIAQSPGGNQAWLSQCPLSISAPGTAGVSWSAGVSNFAPMLDPSQVSVWVCSTNGSANLGTGLFQVIATGTYTFTPITPLLSSLVGPMVSTVTFTF